MLMIFGVVVQELRAYIYTKFVFASVVPGHTDLDAFAKLKPMLWRQDKILGFTSASVAITATAYIWIVLQWIYFA